jgi:hypothetical protein
VHCNTQGGAKKVANCPLSALTVVWYERFVS